MYASRLIRHAVNPGLKKFSRPTAIRTLYDSIKPLTNDCSEIEINVPWGKISGKLWGSRNKQPILAMHGWQDNAGSYDTLAPLLYKDVPILAIDYPGHGHSSWLPAGLLYHEMIYVTVIERLRRLFGWEKVKIMGHSLGAQVSYWYSIIFPKEVQFVIALDALKFTSMDVEKHRNDFAETVAAFHKLENTTTPPNSYTEEEIIKRMISAIPGNLEVRCAKILMERGIRKTSNGKFIISRDPRIKIQTVVTPFMKEYHDKAAGLITCPYLIIKAEGFGYLENKKYFYQTLDAMKKGNEHVSYERVTGSHHVHLANPDRVAKIIKPFLEKYNT